VKRPGRKVLAIVAATVALDAAMIYYVCKPHPIDELRSYLIERAAEKAASIPGQVSLEDGASIYAMVGKPLPAGYGTRVNILDGEGLTMLDLVKANLIYDSKRHTHD
jgi:hypothetical protein